MTPQANDCLYVDDTETLSLSLSRSPRMGSERGRESRGEGRAVREIKREGRAVREIG